MRIKILFLILCIIGGLNMISLADAATYTGSSKTECIFMKDRYSCYSHISTNPNHYIIEDRRWKPYYDARSLKGKGYEAIITEDKRYPINVLDFNATSISVELKITNADLFKQIPLEVYKNKELIYDTSILFLSAAEIKNIIIPIDLNSELIYGLSSTYITIKGENVSEDGHILRAEMSGAYSRDNVSTSMRVGQDPVLDLPPPNTYRAYAEFNLSYLPDDIEFNSAYINFSVSAYTSPEGNTANISQIGMPVGEQTNSDLFNDILNGTQYASFDFTDVSWFNINLASALLDINNSYHSNKLFAVGFREENECDSGFSFYIHTAESASSPELWLYYSIKDTTKPLFYFEPPTPAHNSNLYMTQSATINLSIIESNLTRFIFTWNGTNHSALNDNLIISYNFENKADIGENQTYIRDISPIVNNNAAAYNGVNFTSGKHGLGVSFDRHASQWINALSTTGVPMGNTQRTIEFWMNTKDFGTTADAANGRVMLNIQNDPIGALGRYMGIYAEDNCVSIAFSGHRTLCSSTLLTNTWYHVAVIVPSGATTTGQAQIWINGVNQSLSTKAGSPRTLNTETGHFSIGSTANAGGAFFNGSIDEVKIWNIALSSEQLNQSRDYWLYKNNLTNWNYIHYIPYLETGSYNYNGYGIDFFNNNNISEIRTLNVIHVDLMSGDIIVTPNFNLPHVHCSSPELNLNVTPF